MIRCIFKTVPKFTEKHLHLSLMATESIKFVNCALSLADRAALCSLFSKKNRLICFICLWPYELSTDEKFPDITLKTKPEMNTSWVSLGLRPKLLFLFTFHLLFFSQTSVCKMKSNLKAGCWSKEEQASYWVNDIACWIDVKIKWLMLRRSVMSNSFQPYGL